MKKLFCMLLTAALLCATLPMQAFAKVEKEFTDVRKKDWFAGAVYALTERGIIKGTTETTYSPGQPLTRAQLMQLLASSEATKEELEECGKLSLFADVPAGKWYTASVNWCAQRGIAQGMGPDAFKPGSPVTRAQAASFLVRFANYSDHITLTETVEQTAFADDSAIPSWAREDIYTCQRTGIYNGYNDGTFRPSRQLKRSEAASLLCGLLGIEPLPKSELPDDPPPSAEPVVFTRTVAGVSVKGVEFHPAAYTAQSVLANNKLFSSEPASSIVNRTGAYIAVDGAFFSAYAGGDLTTYGTVMSRGAMKKIDNSRAPYKPTFAVDTEGNASIEFMTINQSASLVQDGQEVDKFELVGMNVSVGASDGARMVYTRDFGTTVPGTIARAAVADEDGTVTKVYKQSASNVPIPEKGFILFERMVRGEWEQFFEKCQVGDQILLTRNYTGAAKQNFSTLMGCGPTVVKNGAAYGNASTYVQEGFTETKVTMGANAKMAIGVKADGTVVIAQANCTMGTLSQVMLGLGCKDAMSLDGGASCALYVKGNAVVPAGRNMNSMLVFTKK